MREGVAHPPQGLQGLLHVRIDQTQAGSQSDPRPEGSQRPIGLEEGVGRAWGRQKDGLQQALQGCIDAGDTHQNGASSTLFKHLQGDGAGRIGGIDAGGGYSGGPGLGHGDQRWPMKGDALPL